MPNSNLQFAFENASPAWIWIALLLLSLVVLVLTYRGIWRRSGRRLTWLLLSLRVLGVVLVILALVKPTWTWRDRTEQRPQLALIFDDSQSMSLLHQDARTDAWATRYDVALDWWSKSDSARSLRDRFDVRLFDIEGRPIEEPHTQPLKAQTDIAGALKAVQNTVRGGHVAGIVLLTDGRDTFERTDTVQPQQIERATYTIGYAPPRVGESGHERLELISATAPKRAHTGHEVAVNVLISKSGSDDAPALDVPVRIERAHQLVKTQTVHLEHGPIRKTAAIQFTATEPGDFVFTVRIPADARQRDGQQDSKSFRLLVTAEPIPVMVIEGVMRHEYTFLRQRLKDDPDVSIASFVRSANPAEALAAGVVMGSGLINDEALGEFQVLLLGDFEARMLDAEAYEAIKKWVEAGGGLMVLGGYANLSPGGLGQTALAELLPVELLQTPPHQLDAPFQLQLTESGRRHPVFAISGDWQRDAGQWQTLPALMGIALVGEAKQGATVLSRHPQSASPGLPAAAEGPIVLATQRYGKGVVALLTADTTWRWSRLAKLAGRSDALYARFWSQTIRWLAQRQDDRQRRPLIVSVDKPSYEVGEAVAVRVHSDPAALVPDQENGRQQVELTMRTPDGRVTVIETNPAAGATDRWDAQYFPPLGGRYELAARLKISETQDADTGASHVTQFLVSGSELELADAATDPGVLEWISQETGGLHARIDDDTTLNDLAKAIPDRPALVQHARALRAWNHPALFLLFLAVITIEWIVRRRNQMV